MITHRLQTHDCGYIICLELLNIALIKLSLPCSMYSLVFSFGLNNRSDKVQATSLPKYRLMIREAQTAFPSAKIHVMEPKWTESLPDNEKNNLKHLV